MSSPSRVGGAGGGVGRAGGVLCAEAAPLLAAHAVADAQAAPEEPEGSGGALKAPSGIFVPHFLLLARDAAALVDCWLLDGMVRS
ncbi:MAG: hypothetical protein GY772_26300 [bacterium]|nr:hypothetical protein [bacterium]